MTVHRPQTTMNTATNMPTMGMGDEQEKPEDAADSEDFEKYMDEQRESRSRQRVSEVCYCC